MVELIFNLLNMDSLCVDLKQLIVNHLKSTEIIKLHIKHNVNKYLKLIKKSSRYELALKDRDYHWIMEYMDIELNIFKTLMFAVKYDLEPIFWNQIDRLEPLYRKCGIVNFNQIKIQDYRIVDYNDPPSYMNYPTQLLLSIYKYNPVYSERLSNKICQIFPNMGDHSINPNISYYLGYHGKYSGNISVDYLKGLVDSGRYDMYVDQFPDDKYKYFDVCVTLSDVRNEDILIILFNKISDTKRIDKNRARLGYIFDNFLACKAYNFIRDIAMNIANLDTQTLRIIIKHDKIEFISVIDFLKNPEIIDFAVDYCASNNQIEKLDWLFDNIHAHDRMIGVLHTNYPHLRNYAFQRFQNLYGQTAQYETLMILYPPETEYTDGEVVVDERTNYINAISNGSYEIIDTDGFIDFIIKEPYSIEDIINTDSTEMLKMITLRMLRHDFSNAMSIMSYGHKYNVPYLTWLYSCDSIKITKLRTISKKVGIQSAFEKTKQQLIYELAEILY